MRRNPHILWTRHLTGRQGLRRILRLYRTKGVLWQLHRCIGYIRYDIEETPSVAP